MKQLILVACLLASITSVWSQDVRVESSAELTNIKPDAPWTRTLGADESGYYLLREYGPISDQKVMVEKYSPDFKPLFMTDVGVTTGTFNENQMHRLTEFSKGHIYIFLEGWSKAKGENSFWVKILGEDGTLPTEATLLETEPASGQMKSANYRVSFSPDGSKLLVLTEKPFAKGEQEKQRLQVFSTADWKSLWKEDIILDNEADKYPRNAIQVDNDGTAYLFKDIKISGKEHHYELYTRNGTSNQKLNLDLQNYFPTDYRFLVNPEGGVIVAGMLATQGSSATNWLANWELRVNAQGELTLNKVEPLGTALLELVLPPKQAAKEGAKLENFVLKDVLLKPSGGLILLAEQYRSDRTAVGTTTPPVYDFDLRFGGIMILSTDKTGNTEWNRYYDKVQVSKTRDPKAHFGSFAYQLKNEKLYLVWNFTELRSDPPGHSFRYWIDRNGAKINIDNLYGKEAFYPTLLTVINPDGSFQYSDRTFDALPLAAVQKPNAFPMAADASLFFPTENGLVLVSRMPGIESKRYKFNTIGF